MIIALPPSEGKSLPRHRVAIDDAAISFDELSAARREIGGALAALGTTEHAAEILSVGPKARPDLAWNVAEPALGGPAHDIYTGVLYAAADLSKTPPASATEQAVWIFSGRYGLVQPADLIAPYRLPAGARLPGIGVVASFWRQRLAPVLDPIAQRDGLVLDCRSGPYQRMWAVPKDVASVEVRAVRERGGSRTVVSHMAKHYRGELTAKVLSSRAQLTDPHALVPVARRTGLGVELSEDKPDRFTLTLVIRD